LTPTAVTLDKLGSSAALVKLARRDTAPARQLYARLMTGWIGRPDRDRATFKLNEDELDLFLSLHLPPTLVECPRWEATYQDPDNPDREVTVTSRDKPPKKKTFRMAGGRTKLTRITVRRITNHHLLAAAGTKGDTNMATTKTRSKRTRKPKEAEVDELEGLEELEDLEELEEPDVEDDEEEAPKPKRSRSRRTKKAAAAPVEDDDDEDEDDEEDEEPAPAAKRSRSTKSTAKSNGKAKRTPPTPPTRELPTGKLGPNDIATLAGVEAKDVRVYLRKQGVAKNDELGRYAFTKKEAMAHAKAIKRLAAQ
jgi:hypothetical protein